jgi:hypothetical protein
MISSFVLCLRLLTFDPLNLRRVVLSQIQSLTRLDRLTQHATIMLAELDPKRVVIIGEVLQLQLTLVSYSEIAGLKMSQMEWTSHVKYKIIAQT